MESLCTRVNNLQSHCIFTVKNHILYTHSHSNQTEAIAPTNEDSTLAINVSQPIAKKKSML